MLEVVGAAGGEAGAAADGVGVADGAVVATGMTSGGAAGSVFLNGSGHSCKATPAPKPPISLM